MIMLTRDVRREEKQAIAIQQQTRLRRPSFEMVEDVRREQHMQNSIPPRAQSARLERSKQMFHQAVFYVGVFYVTWMFGTINRLVQLIGGQNNVALMILHSTFTPMQGFLNFLVYRHGPCVA
mmetsp:Transcript_20889/g.39790  ORF Transcript_20889/g.39790 Transcript_20889/m.39790 type:complete len:122 (-) Transcript_20889:546-911(-)